MFGGAATRASSRERCRLGVELIAEPSTAVRPRWQEPIGLLYIDGKHDYWDGQRRPALGEHGVRAARCSCTTRSRRSG